MGCYLTTYTLEGVENGNTTNGDVSVSWEDDDVSKIVYSLDGGEEILFENCALFDKEVKYVVKVVDKLGNEALKPSLSIRLSITLWLLRTDIDFCCLLVDLFS